MSNKGDADEKRDLHKDLPGSGGLSPDFTAQLLPSNRTQARIRESLAVLHAISVGELLSDLPANPVAQSRHATAVSLLDALEVLLKDAMREFED